MFGLTCWLCPLHFSFRIRFISNEIGIIDVLRFCDSCSYFCPSLGSLCRRILNFPLRPPYVLCRIYTSRHLTLRKSFTHSVSLDSSKCTKISQTSYLSYHELNLSRKNRSSASLLLALSELSSDQAQC